MDRRRRSQDTQGAYPPLRTRPPISYPPPTHLYTHWVGHGYKHPTQYKPVQTHTQETKNYLINTHNLSSSSLLCIGVGMVGMAFDP